MWHWNESLTVMKSSENHLASLEKAATRAVNRDFKEALRILLVPRRARQELLVKTMMNLPQLIPVQHSPQSGHLYTPRKRAITLENPVRQVAQIAIIFDKTARMRQDLSVSTLFMPLKMAIKRISFSYMALEGRAE